MEAWRSLICFSICAFCSGDIWRSAFAIGCRVGSLATPSIVLTWANAETARSAIPAAATPRLRNFINPPTRLYCIKFQYTVGRNAAAPRLFEQLPLVLPGRLGL